MLLIATVNFLLPRALPGDPIDALVDTGSPTQVPDERLRAELADHYGLNRPLGEQKIVARSQELVAADLPLLPLFYPDSFSVVRQSSFDSWYITPGGVAGVIPAIENKQVLVTGVRTGVYVRPIAG